MWTQFIHVLHSIAWWFIATTLLQTLHLLQFLHSKISSGLFWNCLYCLTVILLHLMWIQELHLRHSIALSVSFTIFLQMPHRSFPWSCSVWGGGECVLSNLGSVKLAGTQFGSQSVVNEVSLWVELRRKRVRYYVCIDNSNAAFMSNYLFMWPLMLILIF